MVGRCVTVSVVMSDSVYIDIWCCECYGQQCFVYERKGQPVQWGIVSIVFRESVLFVFGVECVTFSKVVLMERTDKECSVERLVL